MGNLDEVKKEELKSEQELLDFNKESKEENIALLKRGRQEVEEDFISKCMAAFNLSREEVDRIISGNDQELGKNEQQKVDANKQYEQNEKTGKQPDDTNEKDNEENIR